MVKVKGYLACLLFVPFALDTLHTNHCRVCQERWRSVFCHQKFKTLFFCCFHRTFYITSMHAVIVSDSLYLVLAKFLNNLNGMLERKPNKLQFLFPTRGYDTVLIN